MNTEFRPIPGYGGRYVVDPRGNVYAIKVKKLDSLGRQITLRAQRMATRKDKRSGYLVTKLSKPNGKDGSQYVHRLVALAFLPNPLNKPFVNHLNGDKMDPSLENLEWSTRSENQLHAIRTKLARIPSQNYTPVIDLKTGKLFPSMLSAAKELDIDYPKLKKMLSGDLPNTTTLRAA